MESATLRLDNASAETNFMVRPVNLSAALEELGHAQDAVVMENAMEKVHAHANQVGFTG